MAAGCEEVLVPAIDGIESCVSNSGMEQILSTGGSNGNINVGTVGSAFTSAGQKDDVDVRSLLNRLTVADVRARLSKLGVATTAGLSKMRMCRPLLLAVRKQAHEKEAQHRCEASPPSRRGVVRASFEERVRTLNHLEENGTLRRQDGHAHLTFVGSIQGYVNIPKICLLYTSDAADE